MRAIVVALFALLVVAHQDFWNWQRHEPLVFGFIPIGLAHHVGISIAAGALGWLAVRFFWPAEVDDVDAALPRPDPRPTLDDPKGGQGAGDQ